EVILHDEIVGLDQLDAHLLRQESVLEVGAIEASGSEHHHARLLHSLGCKIREHLVQAYRVVVDRSDRHHFKNARQGTFEDLAIFQDVAHTARTPHIVFQDENLPGIVADKISSANVAPNPTGRFEADEGLSEFRTAVDQVFRKDPVLDDFLL